MNPNHTEHLLFLDLEAEGDNIDCDRILEIGAVITDHNLVSLATFTRPIWNGDIAIANRYVAQMHTKSRLLEDVAHHGVDLAVAEEQLYDLLRHGPEPDPDDLRHHDGFLTDGKITLAGSGVSHFDRRWIRRYLPHLEHRLVYWHQDVGVVRRFMRDLVGFPTPEAGQADVKPHRALADAALALEESRAWVKLLGPIAQPDDNVAF